MRIISLLRRMYGPVPVRARWYLASLIVLAASATVLHFRLQEHVQQQAQQMVDQWLASTGGKAGRVHYQLLRGDISIHNIRLSRADMVLHASQAYLHAPLSVLGTGHLVFSDVYIKGLTVDLHPVKYRDVFDTGTQRRVLAALGLLRMTQRVQVDKLLLRAYAVSGQLLLASGRLHLDVGKAGRHLQLHMEMAGGELDGTGEWQWDRAGRLRMQTDWKWQHVGIEPVLVQLDLARWLRGASDGHLSWRADWHSNVHELTGQLILAGTVTQTGEEVERPRAAIDFTVSAKAGQVAGRFDCKAVPLADIQTPTLGGRHLASAVFSGEIRLEGGEQASARWHYTADGTLNDAVYSGTSLPPWRLPQVVFSGLELKLPEQKLRIQKLLATGADVVFWLSGNHGMDGFAPGWKLAVETLALERLHLRLQPDDKGDFLHLIGLHGTGQLRPGGDITLDLRSDGEAAHWRILSHGSLARSALEAEVTASDVPLVQLRPLLPDFSWLGVGEAPELGGDVSLKLHVQRDAEGTHASGSVRAISVLLAHASTRIGVDRLQLDIMRAGTGVMHISRLRGDGWRYQAPLLPMDAAPSAATPSSGDQSHQWRMDNISLNGGAISIGGDAGWMQHVNVHVRGLYAGHDAPISAQGRLGEGALQLSGSVDVFSPTKRFAIRGRLRHALPFFLGDWFAISGAPRITRGRLNADLRLKNAGEGGRYRGVLYLGLYHGQLESGVFPHDALLKLAGYGTQSIFNRLKSPARWWIKVPLAGETRALGLRTLGRQLLGVIRKRMEQAAPADPLVREETVMTLEHIRLHDGKPLSLNERTRLRRMLAGLKGHHGFVIDLQPQLGNEPLDNGMIARIRHTQAMIERFLRRQGITTMRIFPVWPQARHRTGEVGGILIRALAS